MTVSSPSAEGGRGKWLDRASPPHIVTLVLITGLSALNMNIFLPSLPSMAAFFDADYGLVQLAVSAYLGVTAALHLVIGPLSDRYGRRPVILISMLIFMAATVGCILSTDIVVFLTLRMIQAAVASGLVLSRAIVRDMVPTDRAASMIGYVTMGMALVPMVGPMIGGLLDEAFGWQASFVATLIFGVIVFAIAWADLGETNRQRSASFADQFRAVPELITSRRFWGYTIVASCASGAFFAFLGGGPYVASEVLGMTPSVLGLYFGMIAVGYMAGNFLSGRYSIMMGINRMMLIGGFIASVALLAALLLFLAGQGTPLTLFGSIMFVGVGNGMVLPNANAGIVSVRPHLAGSASGLGGAMIIGGGAGISALTGALLNPETGAYPLLLMMLGSSLLSVFGAGYLMHVARRAR